MHLIIDPPVTPLSPLAELLQWSEELEAMAMEYAQHPSALEAVQFAQEDVTRWIAGRDNGPRRKL